MVNYPRFLFSWRMEDMVKQNKNIITSNCNNDFAKWVYMIDAVKIILVGVVSKSLCEEGTFEIRYEECGNSAKLQRRASAVKGIRYKVSGIPGIQRRHTWLEYLDCKGENNKKWSWREVDTRFCNILKNEFYYSFLNKQLHISIMGVKWSYALLKFYFYDHAAYCVESRL